MWFKTKDKSGNRYLYWPLSIRYAKTRRNKFLDYHYWDAGNEFCKDSETAIGCLAGIRGLKGQTFHIGGLKIIFGHR